MLLSAPEARISGLLGLPEFLFFREVLLLQVCVASYRENLRLPMIRLNSSLTSL